MDFRQQLQKSLKTCYPGHTDMAMIAVQEVVGGGPELKFAYFTRYHRNYLPPKSSGRSWPGGPLAGGARLWQQCRLVFRSWLCVPKECATQEFALLPRNWLENKSTVVHAAASRHIDQL